MYQRNQSNKYCIVSCLTFIHNIIKKFTVKIHVYFNMNPACYIDWCNCPHASRIVTSPLKSERDKLIVFVHAHTRELIINPYTMHVISIWFLLLLFINSKQASFVLVCKHYLALVTVWSIPQSQVNNVKIYS